VVEDGDGKPILGECGCGKKFYPPYISVVYDRHYIEQQFTEHVASCGFLPVVVAKKPPRSAK